MNTKRKYRRRSSTKRNNNVQKRTNKKRRINKRSNRRQKRTNRKASKVKLYGGAEDEADVVELLTEQEEERRGKKGSFEAKSEERLDGYNTMSQIPITDDNKKKFKDNNGYLQGIIGELKKLDD